VNSVPTTAMRQNLLLGDTLTYQLNIPDIDQMNSGNFLAPSTSFCLLYGEAPLYVVGVHHQRLGEKIHRYATPVYMTRS